MLAVTAVRAEWLTRDARLGERLLHEKPPFGLGIVQREETNDITLVSSRPSVSAVLQKRDAYTAVAVLPDIACKALSHVCHPKSAHCLSSGFGGQKRVDIAMPYIADDDREIQTRIQIPQRINGNLRDTCGARMQTGGTIAVRLQFGKVACSSQERE